MFGHWFEILALLGLALLVFGPKRMIEMGSQVGKAFRELQNSVKDMNWSSLTGEDEPSSSSTSETLSSKLSQFSQTIGDRVSRPQPDAKADSAPVVDTSVEGSVERVEEHVE